MIYKTLKSNAGLPHYVCGCSWIKATHNYANGETYLERACERACVRTCMRTYIRVYVSVCLCVFVRECDCARAISYKRYAVFVT